MLAKKKKALITVSKFSDVWNIGIYEKHCRRNSSQARAHDHSRQHNSCEILFNPKENEKSVWYTILQFCTSYIFNVWIVAKFW